MWNRVSRGICGWNKQRVHYCFITPGDSGCCNTSWLFAPRRKCRQKKKTSTLGELGLKKMLSAKEPSNQQALNSVWGCKHFSFLGHFPMNSMGAPCFWSKQSWIAPLPAPFCIQTTSRARGYSTITARRPLNGKLCCQSSTFVVLSSLKCRRKLSRQRLSRGAWQSFVLIGLQCACTHLHSQRLFCFSLPLSSQLPYL